MKPIIGITASFSNNDRVQHEQGLGMIGQHWHMLADDCVNSVINAGGIPYIIPVVDDLDVLKGILDNLDGLFVSGGNDINPLLYGKRADMKLGEVSFRRDYSEAFAVKYMVEERKKPYFGVCRGFQILNVALGGSLYMDLPTSKFENHSLGMYEREEPSHTVKLEKDSILYDIFKEEEIYVNSLHHQGVENIGRNLKATAKSEDDLCEAVESTGDNFVLAVQWHPEMMAIKYDIQQEVITRFVEECKKNK